jgi:branched-chain amino acid transport system substrate-binding protein
LLTATTLIAPGDHMIDPLDTAPKSGLRFIGQQGTGPRTSRATRRLAGAGTLGVTALVLAACSAAAPGTSTASSSSSPSTGSTAAVSSAASASGSATAQGGFSAASLKTITAYTGSKPGKADPSLKPVTWGYINQQGGATSFPAYTTEVGYLVNVVNSQLGGIGGHPLKLVVCHVVSSDEDGQSCGQEFANNKAISAILLYPLINGDAAFHSVIDKTGIPVFGPSANSIQDATPTNDFFTSGPNFSNVAVVAEYLTKTLKAKNVAIVGVQGNALTQLIDGQLTVALKAAHVPAKLATVSASSTDVTAPLVAAGVQKADAIVATLPSPPLCANVAKALITLNAEKTPVVSTEQCSSDDTKAILGDYPKWAFAGGYPDPRATPANAREAADLAVQANLFTAMGSIPGDQDFTAPALQGFLTALAVVNKAGAASATSASTIAAAKAFTGPMFLGQDTTTWGKIPGLPAVGTLGQRVYSYLGDGKWVDSGHGWIVPTLAPPPAS